MDIRQHPRVILVAEELFEWMMPGRYGGSAIEWAVRLFRDHPNEFIRLSLWLDELECGQSVIPNRIRDPSHPVGAFDF